MNKTTIDSSLLPIIWQPGYYIDLIIDRLEENEDFNYASTISEVSEKLAKLIVDIPGVTVNGVNRTGTSGDGWYELEVSYDYDLFELDGGFVDYLKDNYSSYDGFISFSPSTIEEWENSDPEYKVGCYLSYRLSCLGFEIIDLVEDILDSF